MKGLAHRVLRRVGAFLFVFLVVTRAALAGDAALVVRGLVVDEGRRPLAGVEVTARLGGEERRTETGGDGRFGVTFAAPADDSARAAWVEARRGEGDDERLAWAPIHGGSADSAREALLVLRPTVVESFTFQLGDAPATGVEARLLTGSKYDRHHIRTLRSDDEGRTVVRGPPGTYTLLVTDPRFAAEDRTFALPRERETVSVSGYDPQRFHLESPRRLRVRVVDDATGSPVAGAYLRSSRQSNGWGDLVAEQETIRTDARGEGVLERLPPQRRFTLSAFAASPRASALETVEGGVEEVEVRLRRETTYTARWPVEPSAQRPADGTELALRAQWWTKQEEQRAVMEAGDVVLHDSPEERGYGYAVHDERVAALLRSEGTARFLAVKTVVVRLLDGEGLPVANQPVWMDGWYLLRDAEGRLTRQHVPGDRTDAEGRIAWEGVFWEPAKLKLVPGPATAAERPLGILDADADVREHVFRLEPRNTVELRITFDGVPGLRPDLALYAGGTVTAYYGDAATGTLRFPVSFSSQDRSVMLSASAPGYTSWTKWFEQPIPEGPLVFDVPLRTVVALSLVLEPEPREEPIGGDVQLQSWDERQERWVLEQDSNVHSAMDFYEVSRIQDMGLPCWRVMTGVAVGRHRLVHVPTGHTSGPFDVSRTPAVQVVRFDVTRVRTVRVRLAGAEGLPIQDALLENAGAAPALHWGDVERRAPGISVADGSFELALPSGEARITVRHPLLRPTSFTVPADADETEVLRVPVEPRILLTVPYAPTGEGAATSQRIEFGFHFSPGPLYWEQRIREEAWTGPPTVRVRHVAPDGSVSWPSVERKHDDAARKLLVGFDQPGTYTLHLEVRDRAPRLLPDVVVPAEGRTLEPVLLARGSAIGVRLLGSPRNEITGVDVTAVSTPGGDRPEHSVGGGVDKGAGPVVVAGLSAGTYRLRIEPERPFGALGGAPEVVEAEVTVDGVSDQELVYDVRPPRER